eukprot:1190683-Pyramimonas_sp.AAC.1
MAAGRVDARRSSSATTRGRHGSPTYPALLISGCWDHPKHDKAVEILPTLHANQDLYVAEDRVRHVTFLLEDESGTFWLRPGEGAFPGDAGTTL